MKRFSRLSALIVSLSVLIGVMSGVTAAQDNTKIPESFQEYTQMCK